MTDFFKRERVQRALDELHHICVKHGVVLAGVCNEEGEYGEILVHVLGTHTEWTTPEKLSNKPQFIDGDYYVNQIGGVK